MTKPTDMLGQETEFEILECFLPHIEPTFVDIGAERGGFSRWMLQRGFKGVAIEPLPKHAAALQELAASGGALRTLNFAVDAEDGQRELHIATDESGQPLDHFHSLQPLTDDARVRHTQAIKVTCRSLCSLKTEGLLPARTGLLKIDTEGNDLRVLLGMAPFEADLLVVEYFTSGLYSGWPDADPLKLITQAEVLGYQHCIAVRRQPSGWEQVSYQPLAFSEREWGNLIFVRQATYAQLRSMLGHCSGRLDSSSQQKTAMLQQCCDERLAVIEQLNRECQRLRNSRENPN